VKGITTSIASEEAGAGATGVFSVELAATTSRVIDIKTAAEAARFNPKATQFNAKTKTVGDN
jgi:hypothetical protein